MEQGVLIPSEKRKSANYPPIIKTQDLFDSLIGEGQRAELRILRLFRAALVFNGSMYIPRSKGLDIN